MIFRRVKRFSSCMISRRSGSSYQLPLAPPPLEEPPPNEEEEEEDSVTRGMVRSSEYSWPQWRQ